MSRTKILLVLVVIAAALVLIFLPRRDGPVDDATTAASISLYGYDDGELLWEIRAADGRIDGDNQALRDVEVAFHSAEGDPLRLRGERLDRSGEIARLTGGIRIERADELLLETEALNWFEAYDRLEAGPISLSTEILHIAADEFGYDLATGASTFAGSVEAHADVGSNWMILAERAGERDGIVSFSGSVKAESADDGTFRCERLEVDSEAERVRLLGDVDGEWTSAQLSAESVELDDKGLRAAGRVSARLDLEEMGESGDP